MSADSTALDNLLDAYTDSFEFNNENKLSHNWFADRVVETLVQGQDVSLLSLGIGHQIVPRRLVQGLANKLSRYVILEGSRDLAREFQLANQFPDHVQIVNTVFEDYTTGDGFDAIEMGFVLEHVADPARILSYYIPFLKSGGSIFVAVPNARSLHRQIGNSAGMLDDYYRLSAYDLELGHQRIFDFESIRNLIRGAGLRILRAEGIFLKPITTAQFAALNLPSHIIDAFFKVGVNYPELSNGIFIQACR